MRRDVIAVRIAEPRTVRVLSRDRGEAEAEAVISMAVYRRGVGTEFYTTAPLGKYADGDLYEPTATIPHEGLVNERDRKIGAGR